MTRRVLGITACVTSMCVVALASSPVAAQAAGRTGALIRMAHSTISPRHAPKLSAGQIRQRLAQEGIVTVDPSLLSRSAGGGEPSIAVNPRNPKQIAITRFGHSWFNDGHGGLSNAGILYSTDGGTTWADGDAVPPPRGVLESEIDHPCPCDQTIDYGQDGRLYGTFYLMGDKKDDPRGIVTGSTSNPASARDWRWNGNHAQLTSGSQRYPDQPWLLTGRGPDAGNGYVAYFATDTAEIHVAVTRTGGPVVADRLVGYASPPWTCPPGNPCGAANPGVRLTTDPRNGTIYAFWGQALEVETQPKAVTYLLNRSTDGGMTWALNGNPNGLAVATVTNDQAPGPKFGGVNALNGGVQHIAVDPATGHVYVVYGQHVPGRANQIVIRRLHDDGAGGLLVEPAYRVSTATDAALPAVAVLTDGTVGVLYDTFDGMSSSGVPMFSAHLARSADGGHSFNDVTLESFDSPMDDRDSRQSVLGDYQQLKAVGANFYGVFSGNADGFGGSTRIDPIFFRAPSSSRVTQVSLTSSPAGPQVQLRATVGPVPTDGTVTFYVDGNPIGSPVPVDPSSGSAGYSYKPAANIPPGMHLMAASYSGNDIFRPSFRILACVRSAGWFAPTIVGPC